MFNLKAKHVIVLILVIAAIIIFLLLPKNKIDDAKSETITAKIEEPETQEKRALDENEKAVLEQIVNQYGTMAFEQQSLTATIEEDGEYVNEYLYLGQSPKRETYQYAQLPYKEPIVLELNLTNRTLVNTSEARPDFYTSEPYYSDFQSNFNIFFSRGELWHQAIANNQVTVIEQENLLVYELENIPLAVDMNKGFNAVIARTWEKFEVSDEAVFRVYVDKNTSSLIKTEMVRKQIFWEDTSVPRYQDRYYINDYSVTVSYN